MGCSCQADPCACDGQFTVLDASSVGRTLARDLAPTVDCLRDLYTSMGLRTYQVALIKTQWSGGERGVGQESVISEELILPTPKVAELTALGTTVEPTGSLESGNLLVTQISPRYTEEQLTGLGADGSALPDDMQFYWEVRFLGPGAPPLRRRFGVGSVPSLSMSRFEWQVRLVKASDDRERYSGAANG